jgi:hypothetical protein
MRTSKRFSIKAKAVSTFKRLNESTPCAFSFIFAPLREKLFDAGGANKESL